VVNYAFWKSEDPQEAADGLRGFLLRFTDTQSSRRSMSEKYAQCVEGMQLTCLGPYGYTYDCETPKFSDVEIPIIRNVAFSLVDTLTSKIGAIDPPLPANLTNKGSWKDRRQAADLELLVRAEYRSPKGLYPNLHEVWIAALRLVGGATGAAAVQYFNDNGKVGARIHDTLDMAWSPDLRTQACVTWLPVDDVVELYPDSEEQIRANVGEPPAEWSSPTRDGEKLTDFVCLYEGWRGGSGGKPGQYVVCVKDGPALRVDDYPHERPPFVWLTCTPHMYGPLGHCLVHHCYESMKRDNLVLSRVDRSIQKTNESTTYATKGSMVNPDAMASTEDHKVVWMNGPTFSPPVTVSPPGFAPEHLTVADRHYQDAHQISGLAQSHTAGERQQGVDSAIGQRYVAALVNERFASLQRRYVQAVAVDSAEVITQILCEIFEEDPKMLRLAPGQDSLKEISGAVALKGIETLKYIWRSDAVSGNKGNPADRMQTAYEMKQLGILSDAGFSAMQGQGFDLPEELDDNDIQRQWVEKQMYRWQFASDEDAAKPGFYIPPFEHMRIGEAMLRVVDGYLEAQMDDLEPERLEFFFMFIADCSALAPVTAPSAAPALPGMPPVGTTPLPPMQGIQAMVA
jgi:hypothetical protein